MYDIFGKEHPQKFRKESQLPKTKSAKIISCENDLMFEIEKHKYF